MISLKRSVSEFDRKDALQKQSLECFRSAVETSGRTALEIDADTTLQYRQELAALAQQVKTTASTDELRETRVSFLGALEDYSVKAARYVKSLREKVAATGRTLAELAESLSQSRSDDRRLQLGLGQLHSIAQDPEVVGLCPELAQAVETVEESVEHLRKKNQQAVVQLQEQVQELRTALDTARQQATSDPVCGLLNHAATLNHIRGELAAGRAFSLVLILISNLDYIYRRYGGDPRDEVLAAFAVRLKESVSEGEVGRWGENQFVVVVSRPKPEAVWLAESFSRDLTGPYFFKEEQRSREVKLQLRTGVTQADTGSTEKSVLKAADQLLIALETVKAPSF